MHKFAPSGRLARPRLGVVTTLLLSLLVASCGTAAASGLQTTTTSSATTTTLAPQQRKLVFAAPYLPTNFNPNTPAGDQSVTRQIMVNVWPSVFYENSKYQTVLNSVLMNSAELVSTNPEEVVYQINPKAVWSDGVQISATDFIYNWQAQSGNPKIVDQGGARYLSNTTVGYSDIKSVKASHGGKTVTVVFKKYFSEWESLFDPLVPAHIAEQVGWNAGFDQASPAVEISGGPYVISAVSPGKQIELTRNPHFWGKAATIPKLIFLDDPNPDNYPSQFQNGSLNLVYSPASDLLYSNLSKLTHVTTRLVPSLSIEELLFNLSTGPLSDPKVRKAIALGIDREAIVSAAIGSYDPKAVPAGNNIYPPGIPQYQNDGSGYLTAVPSAAVSMLQSAGYVRSSDGIMTKDGQPLVLNISVDNANQQLLYVEELITEELSNIGIVVNPVNYPLNTLESSVLKDGKFDMAIVSEYGSPNATLHVARYQFAGSGSSANYMGYVSKKADSLIESASTELDPASSAKVYNQLDQLLWKDLPSIPLYSVPSVMAFNTGYNFVGNSTSSSTIFWNSSTWTYLSPR